MKNESYKIAKLQAQEHNVDAVLKLVGNPIVELIGLVLLCKAIEKKGNFFVSAESKLEELTVFTAGTGLIAVQQLSPLVPTMVAGGQDIIKALPALAPLLLAAGA
jgi:hypothetical protein